MSEINPSIEAELEAFIEHLESPESQTRYAAHHGHFTESLDPWVLTGYKPLTLEAEELPPLEDEPEAVADNWE